MGVATKCLRHSATWILWQRYVSSPFPSLEWRHRMSSPQFLGYLDRTTQPLISSTCHQLHLTVRAELMEGSTLTRRHSARCTTFASLSLLDAERTFITLGLESDDPV